MTNEEYVKTYGNKFLDDVITDFVNDVYTFDQLLYYMKWNEFNSTDVDFKLILKKQKEIRLRKLKDYK